MNNNSINAISPIDGRYYSQTHFLDEFFSEKALIKYRLRVEVEYFIKLTESKINQLSDWNKNNNSKLRDIYINIGEQLDDGSWTFRVQFNYLIKWIWFSVLLMILGILIRSRAMV